PRSRGRRERRFPAQALFARPDQLQGQGSARARQLGGFPRRCCGRPVPGAISGPRHRTALSSCPPCPVVPRPRRPPGRPRPRRRSRCRGRECPWRCPPPLRAPPQGRCRPPRPSLPLLLSPLRPPTCRGVLVHLFSFCTLTARVIDENKYATKKSVGATPGRVAWPRLRGNKESTMSLTELRVVVGGAMDKNKALEAALGQLERSYGKGSVMKLGENTSVNVEAISTGSIGLDIALGIGGLPRGRIIEIFGPESSGKTTLALHVVAE